MDIIAMLLVGLIAGTLAGRVTRGTGFGVLGDIVVGLLGAFVGGVLFQMLGLAPAGNFLYTTLVAFIGALVLIWLVSLFTHRTTV